MTSKLIEFVLFPCLIIALFLSLAGVQQVEFGNTYYNFLGNVSRSFNSWSFSIPKIPMIPQLIDNGFDSGGLILGVLIKIGNFFVNIFNGLISVINVITVILNVIIQLIQFCLTLVYELLNFRDVVAG